MLKASRVRVTSSSRAGGREVRKQAKWKTIFVELLAAIAAGFSSEMEPDLSFCQDK